MAKSDALMRAWNTHRPWCDRCAPLDIHDDGAREKLCDFGRSLQEKFLPMWREEGEALARIGRKLAPADAHDEAKPEDLE